MTAPIRRIFYVPNEEGPALQSGYRRAFADLVDAELLDEVEIFSLERRMKAGGDPDQHRTDLVRAVRRFAPDLLFMQHLGATGLRERDLAAMRSSTRRLAYHEADPYTRRLHPLPRSAAIAGRYADVVFTVGAGVFAENFRRAGAARIEWTPHAFDPARVDRSKGSLEREVDVVMVANRARARVRHLPSSADRARFVQAAETRLGDRFSVYGRGWDGPSARGVVDYSRQSHVLRSAWMSATWDHFALEPCYFSDRLAIALASGSIFATTLHPGYAAVFPLQETRSFLVTAMSPSALVTRIEQHLRATSPAQRLEAEDHARRFAWANLRQDDNLVTMLNAAEAGIDPEAAAASWNLERTLEVTG